MIVFLLNSYLLILAILIWFKVLPFNLFWKVSPVLVLLALLVGLFIPMGWGAPSGPVLVGRQSVQIVPNVAGEVVDVPVAANVALKAGEVLFRIDPTPFDAQVRALDAQLKLAELRLEQMTQLQHSNAGTMFNVQQRQAERDQLQAQRDAAQWNLDGTVVRAPADGYVTNVRLRKGARVSSLSASPAMAFIDTSETIIALQIQQIDARYVEIGQKIEASFKYLPGEIFTGRVEAILPAISTGQAAPSGLAITPKDVPTAPFIVRIALDDVDVARRLPVGSTGEAAIFTDRVTASHVIRRVMLRMTSILNYVVPF
jgi:multidrug resistance efflux pump